MKIEELIDRFRADMNCWFGRRPEWADEHFLAVLPESGVRAYIWHKSQSQWEHRDIPFAELRQRYEAVSE